jgi:Mlc titration factor MtfA (ptsG expression regulator)
MKRFFWWILLFFILLVLIPVFAIIGQLVLAKIVGVCTVLTLSIALWIWKNQSAKLSGAKNRIKLNLNDRFWLNQNCPFYASLSSQDKVVFADRIGLFLGSKAICHHQEIQLVKEDYIAIASSHVISAWNAFNDLTNTFSEVYIIKNEPKNSEFQKENRVVMYFDDVVSHFKLTPSQHDHENNPWLVEFH